MENIIKGDKVLNTKTNTEYVVESIETYENTTVVFTEGDECNCLPISEIIKTPNSWLSNFILKKLNKSYISNIEEEKFDECLSKLKLVSIKPFDKEDFDRMVDGLRNDKLKKNTHKEDSTQNTIFFTMFVVITVILCLYFS